MINIENELAAARQQLLDLTMRNRLLNFRPTKARTITLVGEIPAEIYELLVIKERGMDFLPQREKEADNGLQFPFDTLIEDDIGLTEQEESVLWQLPNPDTKETDRHTDRFLQTSHEREGLQKRLFYIYQDSRSIIEELGYSTLYLAMSFLQWAQNGTSEQMRKAPLLLIPVELERGKVGSSFKLRWNGDDISTNISIQSFLTDQGVSLPDFEMPDTKSGIDMYLQKVSKAISTRPNWQIVNDMFLGFFSFTKFIMYRDLDPSAWPKEQSPSEHPLIKEILSPSDKSSSDTGFREDDIDQKLTFRDLYHVMDADPSQIAVIEDVKSGRNIVVEGPPGTGKSQTITNLIAELLATGKTVLFVSEKMAALEVVKSRLDEVGLGQFCLELHSRKSTRKEFLKEIDRSILASQTKPISLDDDFNQLEILRSQLNGYAFDLREPFGVLSLSPYELFALKEKSVRHFTSMNRSMSRIHFPNVAQLNQTHFAEARWKLRDLQDALSIIGPVTQHSWRGCHPGTVLPADESAIVDLVDSCVKALSKLNTHIDDLVSVSGITKVDTMRYLPKAIMAAKVMASSQATDRHVLENPEWNQPNQQANALITKLELFRSELSKAMTVFKEEALGQNIASLLDEYSDLSGKFLRMFNGRYRALKKHIASLYKSPVPKSNAIILTDLEQLQDCLVLREGVRQSEEKGRALFGSHWHADESNPEKLRAFSEWVVTFRQELLAEALTENALSLVAKGISSPRVEESATNVEQASSDFVNKRDSLIARIGLDCQIVFGTDIEDVSFSNWIPRLELWGSEISKLQRWSQYDALQTECLQSIMAPVVQLIETSSIEPEDIIPSFEGNIADNLLTLVFAKRPNLANFTGDLHEAKISRFADIDRMLIVKNRQRLVHTLQQTKPRIAGGASPGSEAGILKGEISRKKKHMQIRKLMSLSGGLIRKIKPCFMMSPLSIAQFLDPKNARFDVIIFDEASQVKPVDALGALLRGNQVVVMGDTRQLPPTAFFEHIVQSDDDNDYNGTASIADVESILHQCGRSFPTKNLNWHYRSRHESLIAVSNQEFYDNRLLIYPSPIDASEYLGLHFVHLPDAVYDRGRSSTNRKEARSVVLAAMEHYRDFPYKSLGIGAFNIKQQQSILEEVELQLRLHPEMEGFFKSDQREHFFVKNLETIQGDERDVIFISIGFGFDEFRRLHLNFGPLNQDGGHRRLNVLITRAREKCVVFSNFRSADLQIDGNAPFGVQALKTFLDYAENGTLISTLPGEDTDSPFEDSVYDFLSTHGCQVRKQVGCAGFRIDLAVVNADSPGTYLLGIECDGEKYHMSPVARDRDRLRQQILENLGWRIYRIWSTDWYRNRGEASQKLLDAVRTVTAQGPAQGPIHPDPPPITLIHPVDDDDHVEQIPDFCEEHTDDEPIEIIIPKYELCSSLGMPVYGEIHEFTKSNLAKIIEHVVDIEGPVHLSEVVRRIRTLWDRKRSGQRIYDAIENAAKWAEMNKKIKIHSQFLWPIIDRPTPIRQRCGDPPPNIDLICDEEIAEAVKLVLKHQFSTIADDLVVQSSRLLGIQSTRDATANRICKVIKGHIRKGELGQLANGMIHLPELQL